jgi:hypothetical protein
MERSTQLTAELERKDGSDQAMFEGVIELADSSSIESTAKAASVISETKVNGSVLAPLFESRRNRPRSNESGFEGSQASKSYTLHYTFTGSNSVFDSFDDWFTRFDSA